MRTLQRVALVTITVATAVTFSATVNVAQAADNRPAISEDSKRFKCAQHGNRICGPYNANGARPGCYNRNGQLAVRWTHVGRNREDRVKMQDALWAVRTNPCLRTPSIAEQVQRGISCTATRSVRKDVAPNGAAFNVASVKCSKITV